LQPCQKTEAYQLNYQICFLICQKNYPLSHFYLWFWHAHFTLGSNITLLTQRIKYDILSLTNFTFLSTVSGYFFTRSPFKSCGLGFLFHDKIHVPLYINNLISHYNLQYSYFNHIVHHYFHNWCLPRSYSIF